MNIVETILKIALLGSSWVLWLLLVLSVVSIGVMLERIVYFRRQGRTGGQALQEKLLTLLGDGDEVGAEKLLRDSGTFDGGVVASALRFRHGGARAFGDGLDAELSR